MRTLAKTIISWNVQHLEQGKFHSPTRSHLMRVDGIRFCVSVCVYDSGQLKVLNQ